MHWFLILTDAREELEDWRKYYNRSHLRQGSSTLPFVNFANMEDAICSPNAVSLPRQYETAAEALKLFHNPTLCGDTRPSAAPI